MCMYFGPQLKCMVSSDCLTNGAKSKKSWIVTIAFLFCCRQLLHFLQEFSQQTISRTHEIKKQVDGLISETKATDCRLHNVFNDFLMLSNTQFIENVSVFYYNIKPVLQTLSLSRNVVWSSDLAFWEV